MAEDAVLLDLIEVNNWAIIPPNQEGDMWTIFKNFDGEFGYDQEIGWGKSLRGAIVHAQTYTEETKREKRS